MSEDILRLLGEVTATGADRTSISDDLRMRIVVAHERGEGRSGDGVGMDNFGLHKVEKVRQAIKKTGAEPLDLPPDSPNLNPIEKAWARLKQLLRATKARFKGDSIRPSSMLSNSSPPTMSRLGSDYLSSRYSYRDNALIAKLIAIFVPIPTNSCWILIHK